MIYKKVKLYQLYPNVSKKSKLEIYCPSNSKEVDLNRKRKTILLFPGGGYSFTSDRESEPIALRFASYDINVFSLRYVCYPFKFPNPLTDALSALDYIIKNADIYNVDTNNIIVMGFSAGGNLAGNLCVHCNDKKIQNYIGVNTKYKIKGCILGYPVVDVENPINTHLPTSKNISQNNDEYKHYFSFNKYIDKNFPKTFIWTTKDDACVPIINSTMVKDKLDDLSIPCELHFFPHGPHGMSLGETFLYPQEFLDLVKGIEDVKEWVNLALNFIKNL